MLVLREAISFAFFEDFSLSLSESFDSLLSLCMTSARTRPMDENPRDCLIEERVVGFCRTVVLAEATSLGMLGGLDGVGIVYVRLMYRKDCN